MCDTLEHAPGFFERTFEKRLEGETRGQIFTRQVEECRLCRVTWPCPAIEIGTLTAAYAAAERLAAARLIEFQELRAACIETVNGGTDWQCALCLLMWPKSQQPRHDTDCLLAVPPDQAGAELLRAADGLARIVARVADLECVYDGDADEALQAWSRARQRVGEASE